MFTLMRFARVSCLVGTALLLWCPDGTFARSLEQRYALILAPTDFDELASARFYSRGATALKEQLLEIGYSPENITLLSGREATADQFRRQLAQVSKNAGPDDVFVVAIASHGLQLGGVDYLCSTNTSVSEVRAIQRGRHTTGEPTTLVSLQEVIRTMSLSASSKRFLLIDTAVGRNPLPDSASAGFILFDRFGNQAVQVADELWVACSRSGRLDRRNAMTCFMRSVIDGLAGHADDDADGHVSLFEVADYLTTFARAEGYTPPVLHAKAKADFVLTATERARAMLDDLPAELREQLGQAMLEVGKTSLLIDSDPATAVDALRQAAKLAATTDVKREAERLLLTAIAAGGDLAQAWEQAQRHRLPLLVITQIPTRVYQSPRPVGRYYRWNYALEPDVLLEVTETHEQEWFHFGNSYEHKDGVFRPATQQPGWIRAPEFPQATGAANRL